MSTALIVCLIVFVLIFILRMPISLGMIAAGVGYVVVKGIDMNVVGNQFIYTFFSANVIIAVPLFIFTANVMNSGKVTEMVFNFCKAISGEKPGSLGRVNVLASLVFSGMTGSAIADAAGLGKMEIEEMKKEGYDDGFSCAITAASSTIGPIFPPSIPLVIYAMSSGASIGALFMGGMIPALLVVVGLMIYVSYIAKKRNYPSEKKVPFNQFIQSTLKALPAILTPVILLLGIYTGVVTPTEAGAIAAIYAIIISMLVYRAMGPKTLCNVILQTVKDTGATSLMIGAATVISFIVAREGVATSLAELVMNICSNKYMFLLLVNVVILILGMFIDTSTIQLVFVPIMIPMAMYFGIDLVHFGLVVTLNMMIGLSTPPFGMLLFITSGISGSSLKDVMREIMAPIGAMLVVLVVITYIPDVVLFLPKMMGLM
ncbi:MAG: TRAP transporter large permease [Anaerorhabdus sp.]